MLPDFFYDTHHSLLVEHVVSEIADNHVGSTIPTTHFSRQELHTYFENTLYGSDSGHKGSQLADKMIRLWNHLNLVSEVSQSDDQINDGSTCYRFRTRKQTPGTIYEDVSDDYNRKSVEFLIELEAIEQVVEQFHEERGVQSDFSSFS